MNATRKSQRFFVVVPIVVAALATILAARTMAGGDPAPNAVATAGQVTFAKDVAPILQTKCQTCHRDGSIAPMSLISYQEVRPWARAIRQRVLQRSMPPWFIDKSVGIQHFSNDISLSDEQIATIVKWVDGGAPLGNPKDMPAPKVFEDDGGWQLAKVFGRQPDLILEAPDYTVKARDQDQWFRPITDVSLTEPRWAMAVEMRPSTKEGRKVFHHILAGLDQDETNAPSAQVKVSLGPNGADGGGGPAAVGLLMEYAIGKNFDIFREGTGKLIMPGAKIRWEYHTHSEDQDVTAHAQLAVYLYPKGETPKYRTYLTEFGAYEVRARLDIEPNSIHETQGFHVLKAPARLENFQPHMHLRGKAMAMEAILPDGTTRTLSYVDHFNFNWMTNYIYTDDEAPVLPRGTIIHVTAWHDNTTANPNNPDPEQWVGYGERTVDEMAHAWVNVTYISDEEYKDWLSKHPSPAPVGRRGILPAPSPAASNQ
jgi:hypothetical protein